MRNTTSKDIKCSSLFWFMFHLHIIFFCTTFYGFVLKTPTLLATMRVHSMWLLNLELSTFLQPKIVVQTSTQNSIRHNKYHFWNCVQFTFSSAAYECISVLGSTIIWCSQRFQCVLELIYLFTEMLSKTRK